VTCTSCEQPTSALYLGMCRDCYCDWYNEEPFDDEDDEEQEAGK